MANAKVTPILPCRDLDDTLTFYEHLGFEVTYRQTRPNPCAGVRRGGIELQFAGIPAFVPQDSYGSVIIGVADTAALFADFAAGLRAGYGKLPHHRHPAHHPTAAQAGRRRRVHRRRPGRELAARRELRGPGGPGGRR